MALIDAVYSIQANYYAKDPTKGVLNRARAFRESYPDAANDLERLHALGEKPIRIVMGNGKSAGRYKSVCVVEAAQVAAYPHIELHHFDHAIWLHQRAVPRRSI